MTFQILNVGQGRWSLSRAIGRENKEHHLMVQPQIVRWIWPLCVLSQGVGVILIRIVGIFLELKKLFWIF